MLWSDGCTPGGAPWYLNLFVLLAHSGERLRQIWRYFRPIADLQIQHHSVCWHGQIVARVRQVDGQQFVPRLKTSTIWLWKYLPRNFPFSAKRNGSNVAAGKYRACALYTREELDSDFPDHRGRFCCFYGFLHERLHKREQNCAG